MKRIWSKPRLVSFILIGLFLMSLVAVVLSRSDWSPLWEVTASPEALQQFVLGFGAWAPAIFTLLQAAQVVIAAVPAAPIMVSGVAAFGPWWGFFLSLFGAVAGSVVAFSLGRRFGRPVVTRLVGGKALDKYSGKMGSDGLWMLVALMLPLPVGGDAVCSLAGLSEISARRFVLLNVVGRLPLTALTVLTASGLAAGSTGLLMAAGVVLGVLVLAAFLYVHRKKLREKRRSGTSQ